MEFKEDIPEDCPLYHSFRSGFWIDNSRFFVKKGVSAEQAKKDKIEKIKAEMNEVQNKNKNKNPLNATIVGNLKEHLSFKKRLVKVKDNGPMCKPTDNLPIKTKDFINKMNFTKLESRNESECGDSY